MTTPSINPWLAIQTPDNPFPGLRPFEFHESDLFFGRDGQSEKLIAKLFPRALSPSSVRQAAANLRSCARA